MKLGEILENKVAVSKNENVSEGEVIKVTKPNIIEEMTSGVKAGIPESELNLIEKKAKEAAGLFVNIANEFETAIEQGDKKKKVIDEFNDEYINGSRDVTTPDMVEKESVTKENVVEEKDTVDFVAKINVQNRRERLKAKLSKLEKLRVVTKRGNSITFPLLNSGFNVTMYASNSYLLASEAAIEYNKTDTKYFQSMVNLKNMYNNMVFNFIDGEKVSFQDFMNIIDPRDIELIYILHCIVNAKDDSIQGRYLCKHCGSPHDKDKINFQYILNNIEKMYVKDLVIPTDKTIDELQKDLPIGKEVVKTYIIDSDVSIDVTLVTPSAGVRLNVENAIKAYIVNSYNDTIPDRIKGRSIVKRLEYILNEYDSEIENLMTLYSGIIYSLDSITITYKETHSVEHFTLKDDGVSVVVEALKTLDSLGLLADLNKDILELNGGYDYEFLEEPYECPKCGNITPATLSGIDALFFTAVRALMK